MPSYTTGEDLRRMQHKAGLTTSQMAKLAGVKTRKTYENWTKDVGEPTLSQFLAMSVGCQLNTSILVKLILNRRYLTDELDLGQAELTKAKK
jgi:transcriptional regulator with XRE-family HTH domain